MDEVTWRARCLGVRWTMAVRVTKLDEPLSFVDEQVRGPFRCFRHEHRFAQVADGSTAVDDRLELSLPLGRLGQVVAGRVLSRTMGRVLADRATGIAAALDRR